jgi:hypothetical protein
MDGNSHGHVDAHGESDHDRHAVAIGHAHADAHAHTAAHGHVSASPMPGLYAAANRYTEADANARPAGASAALYGHTCGRMLHADDDADAGGLRWISRAYSNKVAAS